MPARPSKFSSDPILFHPVRLKIAVHLARGGRDNFTSIVRRMEPASETLVWHYLKRMEKAGYTSREVNFVARGQVRTWHELTQAGRDALTNYRTSILEMIDGPQPAMGLPASNAMEEVNTS